MKEIFSFYISILSIYYLLFRVVKAKEKRHTERNGRVLINKVINNPSPPAAELPLHKGAFRFCFIYSDFKSNLSLITKNCNFCYGIPTIYRVTIACVADIFCHFAADLCVFKSRSAGLTATIEYCCPFSAVF